MSKTNRLEGLNKLNDINFKVLVYFPLIYILTFLVLATWARAERQEIPDLYILSIAVILFLIQVVMFIKDRNYLKKNNAYCPAWLWIIIFPVYVYKRQDHNFLSKSYFFASLVFFIIEKLFNAYLKSQGL